MLNNVIKSRKTIADLEDNQLTKELKSWLTRIDNYIQLAADLKSPTTNGLDEYFDNSYNFIDHLYHRLKSNEALSFKERSAIRMTLKETEKMAICNNIAY